MPLWLWSGLLGVSKPYNLYLGWGWAVAHGITCIPGELRTQGAKETASSGQLHFSLSLFWDGDRLKGCGVASVLKSKRLHPPNEELRVFLG